ncbi:MAG: hypothetical protein IKF19_06920 [Bacilli bacterium]|nr:hypothetical protein [Bacilli bacterium]
MVDNKKGDSFLIIVGFIILGVFVYVSVLNILPNNSSNSYFSKDNDFGINISKIVYDKGEINVYVPDDNISICIKQTKSIPEVNSMCWKSINNGYVGISAFSDRKYYVWMKNNTNNNISDYIEYKTIK